METQGSVVAVLSFVSTCCMWLHVSESHTFSRLAGTCSSRIKQTSSTLHTTLLCDVCLQLSVFCVVLRMCETVELARAESSHMRKHAKYRVVAYTGWLRTQGGCMHAK
jgi:hypothetical protein